MGWVMVPKPGTKTGPCLPTCAHLDCRDLRLTAESICHYCGQPIGYETAYYREGWHGRPESLTPRYVHATCLWDAEGKRQQEEK